MVNRLFNKVIGENEKGVFYFYLKTEWTIRPTQYEGTSVPHFQQQTGHPDRKLIGHRGPEQHYRSNGPDKHAQKVSLNSSRIHSFKHTQNKQFLFKKNKQNRQTFSYTKKQRLLKLRK